MRSAFDCVAPDICHPALFISFSLTVYALPASLTLCQNYSDDDYALLYEILSTFTWTVFSQTSVEKLRSAVTEALDSVFLLACPHKTKYQHRLSNMMKYYNRMKSHICLRYKKKSQDIYILLSYTFTKLIKLQSVVTVYVG